MLQTSYEMWGMAFVAVLTVVWTIKVLIRRSHRRSEVSAHDVIADSMGHDHDMAHRALMFLMTQKTDALLAALAHTIEQERQKLGGIVRNPSKPASIDAFQADAPVPPVAHQTTYEQILPMARSGAGVGSIARQLHLPEAEVCMVMRLHAA